MVNVNLYVFFFNILDFCLPAFQRLDHNKNVFKLFLQFFAWLNKLPSQYNLFSLWDLSWFPYCRCPTFIWRLCSPYCRNINHMSYSKQSPSAFWAGLVIQREGWSPLYLFFWFLWSSACLSLSPCFTKTGFTTSCFVTVNGLSRLRQKLLVAESKHPAKLSRKCQQTYLVFSISISLFHLFHH